MLHRHNWKIITTTYVGPLLTSGMKATNLNNIESLLTPHSYVVLRCSVCGDLKEKELHGKVELAVDTSS